ncbi:DNA-binding transcriptional regulator Fis [Franzmannia qiaohouensis]|uniref:Putative Fis-like DNA-binding protein n=1 Tax=Franzmannia qiaohouensis TaxID=1329370 RepID=A0ABU1HIL5_9GAMM|nr:DNA-binding transcriptional regulator Fis [Halomonas qiaohouensis]MDR5907321.1 DNA-binding transcriptional regulator Fis [Halomonas qiaohouensis]
MTSRQPTQPGSLMAAAQESLDLAAALPSDNERALAATPTDRPLREAVDVAMRRYFAHLDGESVTDLYAMVLAEVEAPLLTAVMDHVDGNQTRAADMLGLNRGTLRKKLKQYDLI